MLFSLFEIRRSAITPSTALHVFAPTCALRRTSLSLSSHLRTRPLLGTRNGCPESASFPPARCPALPSCGSISVFSILIFSPCLVNSPSERLILLLFAIRHQGQVVCIEEFLYGILRHRRPADKFQCCYEQQRAQHAALSECNLDLKLLR